MLSRFAFLKGDDAAHRSATQKRRRTVQVKDRHPLIPSREMRWKLRTVGRTEADPHIGDHDIVEASRALLETHHIDIIPENERRGRPRDQFTLWFAANASVVAFVLGGLAIAFGLNLFWALVAIVVGNVLGAVLVSYHAWQGPRLGVPQMIQSRGQFGFYGAGFIFLASILLDVGYMAASQVLQGQALNLWAPSVSIPWWIIIATIPAVVVAIFGYRWIHNVQKVMTAIFIVVIAIALIQAALYGPVAHESLGFGLSSFPIFIAVIGLVFMNMLSWAPYVSDYSRYLPVDVSFRRTFWAIFSGQIRRWFRSWRSEPGSPPWSLTPPQTRSAPFHGWRESGSSSSWPSARWRELRSTLTPG